VDEKTDSLTDWNGLTEVLNAGDFRPISRFISDMIQDHIGLRPWLLWNTNRNLYAIYIMVPFPMTLNDPNPYFNVVPLYDAFLCLRNGIRDRDINSNLHIPTLGYRFE